MIIKNNKEFDDCKLSIKNLKKNNSNKHILIEYNNSDLDIVLKNLKYVNCIYNNKRNIYILKFIIDIDNDFFKIINNIEKKIKYYLIKNKNIIFSENFLDDDIDNLYFTNIETSDNIKIINLNIHDLSCLNSKMQFNENSLYNVTINLPGIWFYENLYGISFNINNIKIA